MVILPDYVPVVAVSGIGGSLQQELYGKLRASLEAAAIRLNRVDRLDQFVPSTSILHSLGTADLLLVESETVEVGARLRFDASAGIGCSVAEKSAETNFYCAEESDLQRCTERIMSWLDSLRVPLYGAILIGGKSSRMGRPKHLLQDKAGKSWLEGLAEKISPFVEQLVISGQGEVPGPLRRIERIDDLPGMHGPLAGIGALFRKHPFTSWLVSACDMPQIDARAIDWLLAQRQRPGVAVLPRNPESGRFEPLLACYDYRCGPLIESLIRSGSRKISELAENNLVVQPEIPIDLIGCWQNVNYPDELP